MIKKKTNIRIYFQSYSETNLSAFKPAVLRVIVNFAISSETYIITATIEKQPKG